MSRKQRNLEAQEIPKDLKLSFSFEFYDTSNDEYCLSKFSTDQVKKTLNRLKEYSAKTFNEMSRESKVLHFGQVYWERTIKPNGFNNSSLKDLESFHFGLLGVNGQLTRVYGAYARGVFYIVWFDLHHAIWPTPLRGT